MATQATPTGRMMRADVAEYGDVTLDLDWNSEARFYMKDAQWFYDLEWVEVSHGRMIGPFDSAESALIAATAHAKRIDNADDEADTVLQKTQTRS